MWWRRLGKLKKVCHGHSHFHIHDSLDSHFGKIKAYWCLDTKYSPSFKPDHTACFSCLPFDTMYWMFSVFCHLFRLSIQVYLTCMSLERGRKLEHLAEARANNVRSHKLHKEAKWNLCPSCCDTAELTAEPQWHYVATVKPYHTVTDGGQLHSLSLQWAIPPDSFAWPWQQSHCDSDCVDVSTLGRQPNHRIHQSSKTPLPLPPHGLLIRRGCVRLCWQGQCAWAGHNLTKKNTVRCTNGRISLLSFAPLLSQLLSCSLSCHWSKRTWPNYQHTNRISFSRHLYSQWFLAFTKDTF